MKIKYLLFSAFAVLVSCSTKPVASFQQNKTEVTVGEPVQFTSTSSDAYYYHWKFGDGSSSRLPNPVHTYTQAGYYDVRLHVSTKGGDSWNTTDPVPVTVWGYNQYFTGQWNVWETDTTDLCGNPSHPYILDVRKGNQADELILSNLGDFFNTDIRAVAVENNPDKLEINESDVMAKDNFFYYVNGYISINNNSMNMVFTLSPRDTSSCGSIKGYGVGVHF